MGKKKEANIREQNLKIIENQNKNIDILQGLNDDQLDYVFYQIFKYAKVGIGYNQCEGELIQWMKLLELHREWHQLRVSGVPDNETDRIIWEEGMKEVKIAFREDIDDWFLENFKEEPFNLEYTLSKNWKHICNVESLQILSFYVRKIAKQLGKNFSNIFRLKTLKDTADKFCKIQDVK